MKTSQKRRAKRKRNPEATQFARDQRETANEFAQDVWQWLRNRRCCGEKFRREHPIAPYTVDFCCVSLKLIIEIDGKDHFTEQGRKHDRVRDQFLQQLGYDVLRISGYDVLGEPQEVRKKITASIQVRQSSLAPKTQAESSGSPRPTSDAGDKLESGSPRPGTPGRGAGGEGLSQFQIEGTKHEQ